MQLRRHALLLTVALVVSSACSAEDGGEGNLASRKSTTTAAASFADGPVTPTTVPQLTPNEGGPLPPPSVYSSSHHGQNSPATTTTTQTGSGPTTTTPVPSTTVPPGLPPEKCPEPKTCRAYAFTGGNNPPRFPTGSDGRATVEYWINPTGLSTERISVEQAEGAIATAFATWQNAAPILRFVYKGRTNRPAAPSDGFNVVSFQGANNTSVGGTDGHPEFDIQLAPAAWRWAPCEQRDNSCTPVGFQDLQSIVTHEAGHALWMGHPTGPAEQVRLMTMWPGDGEQIGNDRFWSTLALGDVLGIRSLYPCSCPLPPIYDP